MHVLGIDSLTNQFIWELFDDVRHQKLETKTLENEILVNIFLEPSTRTRTSFEIAGHRLQMKVINMIGNHSMSLCKGESLDDTLTSIAYLGARTIILRIESCLRESVNQTTLDHLSKMGTIIINGGDSSFEHPTQALLDAYCIFSQKGFQLDGIKVLFLGDIQHSRVAHSEILLLHRLGAKILIVKDYSDYSFHIKDIPIIQCNSIEEALTECDVSISLRAQVERYSDKSFRGYDQYRQEFGLNKERLKLIKEDTLIMHPGPVFRGIEMDDDVLSDPRCFVNNQVKVGVEVRMALIKKLAEKIHKDKLCKEE